MYTLGYGGRDVRIYNGQRTTTNACNFAFLFLNTHLFPSFNSVSPNNFLFFISLENLILFKFMMLFFSLSHYLWLTGIQRKSTCSLSGVGVKNVELLLVSGPPFTYMTNWSPRKEKMEKKSCMRSQRDIEEIR
jgi:hypothetical protein